MRELGSREGSRGHVHAASRGGSTRRSRTRPSSPTVNVISNLPLTNYFGQTWQTGKLAKYCRRETWQIGGGSDSTAPFHATHPPKHSGALKSQRTRSGSVTHLRVSLSACFERVSGHPKLHPKRVNTDRTARRPVQRHSPHIFANRMDF